MVSVVDVCWAKKKEAYLWKCGWPSLPNLDPTILADNLQETDSELEDDFGKAKWDPHASIKPPPLDGEASDGDWGAGDDWEEAEGEAFNLCMVQMLLDLDDLHDPEWKPMCKQKKWNIKSG